VKSAFKFFYYFFAMVVGWYILKDDHVCPPMLGGKGSFYNQFKNWPYIKSEPLYKFYYMGTMGFHTAQLVQQVFFESWKKSDFLEMTIHHIVTVYLFGYSYMAQTWIGVPVAFLHNIADVFVSLTRFWAETNFKKTAGYCFLIAVIVWGYTRIYVFPQLIWASCVKLEIYTASPWMQPIFGGLMTCLFLLHVYWIALMLKILGSFLFKGVAEDTVNDNSSSKRKNQ
jgi:hypothetical protein